MLARRALVLVVVRLADLALVAHPLHDLPFDIDLEHRKHPHVFVVAVTIFGVRHGLRLMLIVVPVGRMVVPVGVLMSPRAVLGAVMDVHGPRTLMAHARGVRPA
jgi:hypothetical protein